MTVTVEDNYFNEEFLALQRMNLQLENRASRGARFRFTTNRRLRNVSSIEHVHDLDLADPFMQ